MKLVNMLFLQMYNTRNWAIYSTLTELLSLINFESLTACQSVHTLLNISIALFN